MDTEAIEILREIRDEARQTNARLDQTNLRLDQTNLRLDQTNARLGQTNACLDQVVGRLEGLDSAMRELGVQQRFVVRYVKAISEREARLDDELSELRLRVELIEARLDTDPP